MRGVWCPMRPRAWNGDHTPPEVWRGDPMRPRAGSAHGHLRPLRLQYSRLRMAAGPSPVSGPCAAYSVLCRRECDPARECAAPAAFAAWSVEGGPKAGRCLPEWRAGSLCSRECGTVILRGREWATHLRPLRPGVLNAQVLHGLKCGATAHGISAPSQRARVRACTRVCV
jgi:hypothetical protein